ncbi:DUF3325 family protein [Rhodopseudomonas sp. B29]|uniref:DUF3325 family protein n=1 Tax=Rhodopseudomonas sp. B29 TaxID=95607 RepID=UPI0003468EBF|nr:DUF3325 family protein [Rhodopseudomonas sp. B29]
MSHAVVQALCLAGFAALALATRRLQRDAFGSPLRPAVTLALRSGAAALLLLSLAVLVTWQGWGVGLVMFSGHTTLAAALVYCALIGYGRLRRPHTRSPASNN